jgi:hypothetical protein
MLLVRNETRDLLTKIEPVPIKHILGKLKRKSWIEGLYVRKKDLDLIKRYKNADGSYKNDFNELKFVKWVTTIQSNIAICEMRNKEIGSGVFVLPKATLPKGTFIPSSGIIKLNPTREELETKNHCSALQDLDLPNRKIYGLIDPGKKGGILDLINHAPDSDEIANFNFLNEGIKDKVAMANLKGTIKFYNGYAIMGVEAYEDIDGGKYGKQLLWSYAQPDEYLTCRQGALTHPTLYLFDNRGNHSGEIIDPDNYSLRKINIFLDTGELVLRKVATLTRWELMQAAPESDLTFSLEDPYSSIQSDEMPSPIPNVFLQTYLKNNPAADRVIIQVPTLKKNEKRLSR